MGSKKVTKADIVDQIYLDANISKKDAKVVIEHFFDVVKKSLAEDGIVELRGFGTFELKQRKGRENARNPKSGDVVTVKPHCVVSFRSGKELKAQVWDVKKEGK